jgi:ribonuclease P/MRP protein subunit POP5
MNKPLLPSLRERKRYLAFTVLSKRTHPAASVSTAILASCHRMLGELECARAGIQFMTKKYQHCKGIIRVSHTYTDKLKACLVFVDQIDSEPVIVRSLGLSGMLNKAERYLEG